MQRRSCSQQHPRKIVLIAGKLPTNITGEGQGRGNSGLFLAAVGGGDGGYELQILDSYKNKTYVNGQAGSVYGNLMQVSGQLEGWSAATGACKGRAEAMLRSTIGPAEPTPIPSNCRSGPIAASGSTAVVEVVPTVAQTSTGV